MLTKCLIVGNQGLGSHTHNIIMHQCTCMWMYKCLTWGGYRSSQSSNRQPSVRHTDEPQSGRNSYLWLFHLCWITGTILLGAHYLLNWTDNNNIIAYSYYIGSTTGLPDREDQSVVYRYTINYKHYTAPFHHLRIN